MCLSRSETEIQEITIEKFTASLADAGEKSGKPGFPGSVYLPKDDADLVELETLTQKRRISRSPIERQTLSLSIYRARSRVNTKKADLEHINAVKTGRAPKRNKKNPQITALFDYRNETILLDDEEEIIDNI